jgi:hypothetical protein
MGKICKLSLHTWHHINHKAETGGHPSNDGASKRVRRWVREVLKYKREDLSSIKTRERVGCAMANQNSTVNSVYCSSRRGIEWAVHYYNTSHAGYLELALNLVLMIALCVRYPSLSHSSRSLALLRKSSLPSYRPRFIT